MSETKSAQVKSAHEIILISRENLSINGVKDIVNFDENTVNLKTVCGDLSVEGEKLHINVLNIQKGDVEIYGKISGLFYFDSTDSDKQSLLSRIFK